MKDFKFSQYNISLPIEGEKELVLWNTRTGSIVRIERQILNNALYDGSNSRALNGAIDNLIKQGILVNSNLNEFNEILYRKNKIQHKFGNSMQFVIAPTLQCNFSCSYCFENNRRNGSIMDEKVILGVANYIEKEIIANKLKKIRICWFGGEPMMGYKKAIVPLSERLLEICNRHDIVYDARITTNGYFLTEELALNLIINERIRAFQITLDGDVNEYCEAKNTSAEAFNQVKNNIFLLAKLAYENNIHCKINIRLNATGRNIDSIFKLVDDMKSDPRFKDNIHFYLAKVFSNDKTINGCLSLNEFEIVNDAFQKKFDITGKFFNPLMAWCPQHTMGCFCIGPKGELYKCEHDFGDPEKCIGHVETGLFYTDYFNDFMFPDVAKKCIDCKLFPVCLGGCPSNQYKAKDGDCISTVENAIKNAVMRYFYLTTQR